jgi:hypothetical protein
MCLPAYTVGSGSFPGVKRRGRGVDHPPSSSAEVKERVELHLNSPSGPSWPVLRWTLPLPFTRMYQLREFCTYIQNIPSSKTELLRRLLDFVSSLIARRFWTILDFRRMLKYLRLSPT